MKEQGLHEGCIEQVNRLFRTQLYNNNAPQNLDQDNRIRLDDWELRDDVQQQCREIWPKVTTENLFDLTDYASYKDEFLQLFGFNKNGVDYDKDIGSELDFDVETL